MIQLQHWLNVLGSTQLFLDGNIGNATIAVYERVMNTKYTNATDAWNNVRGRVQNLGYNPNDTFVVAIDCGHGGLRANGTYATPPSTGKFWKHPGNIIHNGTDTFFEGFENRIIGEAYKRELDNLKIPSIMLADRIEDTSLIQRTRLVNNYTANRFKVFVHSIHSNAAPTQNNSQAVLNRAIGYSCFTSVGQNFSDRVAEFLINETQKRFPTWNYRVDPRDGDKDHEAQFHMLTQYTQAQTATTLAAILEEFGFYTSLPDTLFIINPQNRRLRVEAQVATAVWVRQQMSGVQTNITNGNTNAPIDNNITGGNPTILC